MFAEVEAFERFGSRLTRLLEAVRSGEVSLAQSRDLLAASQSVEAKVAVLQTELARLIAVRERHGDGGTSVLCDSAGKSRSQARRSLAVAETLDEMPELRSALDAGEVSLTNAESLARAAQKTAPEAVDETASLLAKAKELPPDRFAREVDTWTQSHQADHGHGDYLRQRQQRYLRIRKESDSVRLDGRFDLEFGTRLAARIQRTAERLRRQDDQAARADGGAGSGTGDGEGRRTWDQLQADALDQLTSGTPGSGDGNGSGSSGSKPKAEVIVVADIGVLTGDDPAGRCEIPGTGPVPPEVLERIACDAELTGILFHKGKPLYHGATVRTATKDQWRALIARDGGCIGCGAEPRWCQAHHVVPYAQSRRTDIDNLVLVCWRCHHNIHDHNWRVTLKDGKRALQPPDPLAPPNPAEERRPHRRPDRHPPPTRTRAAPRPTQSRPGPTRLGPPENTSPLPNLTSAQRGFKSQWITKSESV